MNTYQNFKRPQQNSYNRRPNGFKRPTRNNQQQNYKHKKKHFQVSVKRNLYQLMKIQKNNYINKLQKIINLNINQY